MKRERWMLYRLLRQIILIVFTVTFSSLPLSGEVIREFEHRSLVEMGELINKDVQWLAQADFCLGEMKSLNVRIYSLINSVQNPRSWERLVNERKTIRRLICELNKKMTEVSLRLEVNRREFDQIAAGVMTDGEMFVSR